MINAPLSILVLSLGLTAVAATGAGAVKDRYAKFASYQNAKHGFSIAFPEGVFKAEADQANEDGQMFVSADGKARLLVGAFVNEDQRSLKDYRQFVLEQSYSGAAIDYAPVKDRWFVLSGQREGNMFYERVSFTCGGKLINSWAMVYPVAERARYDRVVEAVARGYTPGAGRTGKCD